MKCEDIDEGFCRTHDNRLETCEIIASLRKAIASLRKAALDYRNLESYERAEELDKQIALCRPHRTEPAGKTGRDGR